MFDNTRYHMYTVILLMEEILHQLIGSLYSLYLFLQSFIYPRWLFGISSINSMGVSKNRGGPPKSSILIGLDPLFSPFILVVFPPLFLEKAVCFKKGW